jgi:hypothetical protein
LPRGHRYAGNTARQDQDVAITGNGVFLHVLCKKAVRLVQHGIEIIRIVETEGSLVGPVSGKDQIPSRAQRTAVAGV